MVVHSAQNDLYGVLGCLLHGIYGGSMLEKLLGDEDANWEETEWEKYTELIRIARRRMLSKDFMQREIKELKIKDPLLKTVLLEVGKKRSQRMPLAEMMKLATVQ